MQVQVQQLVHHVSANTDNLTAGIQTCRSVGGLLQTAITSCSQVVLTCQAMLLLAAQYQQLNEPHLKPLTTQQPLLHRCIGLQGLLDDLIAAAVQRVCAEFDPNDVDSLVSLHVLNVQSGAEMPELIRDAYLALVSSSDQFSSSAHPPCALQTALYREAQKDAQARPSDAPHGSDLSLAALFKAIPALKFRARAEWLMQTQFDWLQNFHAMQLHVQDELAAVRCMLASLSEGAEAIVDWSSGLPRVTVSGEEASLGAAQGRPDGSSTPGAPMSPQWQARPGEEPDEARALSPAAVGSCGVRRGGRCEVRARERRCTRRGW